MLSSPDVDRHRRLVRRLRFVPRATTRLHSNHIHNKGLSILDFILEHVWQIVGAVAILGILAAYRQVLWLVGVIIVPDDSVGVVTKKFVLIGSHRSLPDGRILALNGEAGYQADTLAPGLHLALWPWQYAVELVKFVEVPVGSIGVVEACDGQPLPSGRILARRVDCDMYQDARLFLQNGGQRGPQLDVIPPGTYRINPLLFKITLAQMTSVPQGKIGVVEAHDGSPLQAVALLLSRCPATHTRTVRRFSRTAANVAPKAGSSRRALIGEPHLFSIEVTSVVDIPDNKVGIVTTREGQPLQRAEIAGPEVPGHNMFQNPEAFIANGGCKGMQEQVLLPGRYFINPRFATVETVDMTEVPIAHVGVVISYVGKDGKDVTGEAFKHANLVSRGEKGVWIEPLDPGKYPINPYTHNIKNVPTANVVLNWANGKSEAHELDANLSTITVRSADGFKFNLDVSQIIHIPRNDAPKVIARFGDMAALVTQVLEPTIGNYFRNSAQDSDIIEFLRERSKRQSQAREAIGAALSEYNVGAVDTLIGDIVPPEQLMKTLTDRKLAEQERVTYETQKGAQAVRQELEQATALANTQANVVDAERQVSISEFNAQAAVKRAEGEAKAKTINAEADAKVVQTVGEAEAKKVEAIGMAEATVIKQKIDSMQSDNYAVVQVAEALASAGVKLVPDVVANGSGGASGGTLVDILLAGVIRDGLHRGAPTALPVDHASAGALPAPNGASAS